MTIENNRIRFTFSHTGSGLSRNEDHLMGLAIAGTDHQFVWADAVIEDNTVLVSSSLVSNPVAVRYGWANNPAGASLINREGLPASPFLNNQK